MASGIVRNCRNIIAGLVFAVLLAGAAFAQADPLPSWNDGPVKKAITDFVARVAENRGLEGSTKTSTKPRPKAGKSSA